FLAQLGQLCVARLAVAGERTPPVLNEQLLPAVHLPATDLKVLLDLARGLGSRLQHPYCFELELLRVLLPRVCHYLPLPLQDTAYPYVHDFGVGSVCRSFLETKCYLEYILETDTSR